MVACASSREADLVIREARLLIGDGAVVDNATVVMDDGQLIAIGNNVGKWQGLEEIDAAGKTVLPGLIDTHVHLLALGSESLESLSRFFCDVS